MGGRLVFVDNWQMQCCGTPFNVGSTVEWTVMPPDRDYLASVLGDEAAARVTDAEEHHGGDEGRESQVVTGKVRSIEAVVCRYAPSGSDPRSLLYPVAGTAVLTALDAADGWESEISSEEGGLLFVGYVVGLEAPQSA